MRRLFPRKFIFCQNYLLDKETSKQIIASCDRITDSNLIVNTETELNEIQKRNSKLIKDYLINYARDKGVFGGIYYEKNPADEKIHLFVVEFFIFQNVPTTNGKITDYSDYIGAIATPIDENGKIENYYYTGAFSSNDAIDDIKKYTTHIQIEGLWLEYLKATNYTSAYEEAQNKLSV